MKEEEEEEKEEGRRGKKKRRKDRNDGKLFTREKTLNNQRLLIKVYETERGREGNSAWASC